MTLATSNKERTGRRRSRTISFALLVGAVGLCIVVLCRPFIIGGTARKELTRLHEKIKSEFTIDNLRQEFQAATYPHLQLRQGLNDTWIASTPTQFGAGNWILYIEFKEKTAVAARIRTLDDLNDKPPQAPADKIFKSL
jgi:hypothetical protein